MGETSILQGTSGDRHPAIVLSTKACRDPLTPHRKPNSTSPFTITFLATKVSSASDHYPYRRPLLTTAPHLISAYKLGQLAGNRSPLRTYPSYVVSYRGLTETGSRTQNVRLNGTLGDLSWFSSSTTGYRTMLERKSDTICCRNRIKSSVA